MYAIALIGAGRIGQIHAANIAAHPKLNLAMIVDPMPGVADRLASQYGSSAANIDEALGSTKIDGIVVASSTDTHLEYCLAAAGNGKPVFCEKPLDLDLDRARAAVGRLGANGARILLGFNRRFDHNFAALHRRIRDGGVGRLETLHIVSHDPAPPPVSYLATSGGIFKDMVIHDFDMARWLLDEEPDQVFATTSCLIDPAIAQAGDADTAKTILRTPSGRLCVISSSRRSGYGYDQRVEAFGSTGMIRVGNMTETTLEHWRKRGAAADAFQNFFLDRYAGAYAREIDHFADMLGGATPMIDYRDGVAALALAEAAARSAKSGRFEVV